MDYMDFHADTLTEIREGDLIRNTRDVDLTRVGMLGGRYAQVFALWKDMAKVKEPDKEFTEVYNRALELLKSSGKMVLCRTADEMKTAFREGKHAAFLSVEDCSFMGKNIEKIKELGIRFAIPTWNYENRYGCGAVAGQDKGLTQEGKELLGFLNGSGIMVDVAHLSDQGIEEVLLFSDRTVLASHSDVRAVQNMPRNLSDAHIREIIRRDGVIGMNLFRPFLGDGEKVPLIQLFRHMDHILNMGGENALVWGCDFDGSDGLFPEGISGVQGMPLLAEKMKKAGFSEELLQKIFFENGYRFMERNL